MDDLILNAVRTSLTLPKGENGTISLALCEGATEKAQASLGPAEARRAQEFLHPKARQSFVRGRLAAKAALRELRGASDATFEIVNGLFGRPQVQMPNADLGISISHHGETAVAVAFPVGWPLGIDLATIDARNLKTIRTQVNAEEERKVRALGFGPEQATTALWAAKEAVSKVLGGGLGIGFEMLAIKGATDGCPALRLQFQHVGHLEADILIGPRQVIALAMPHHARLDWVEIMPLLGVAGGAL